MSLTVILFLFLLGLGYVLSKAVQNPATTGKLLWGLAGK